MFDSNKECERKGGTVRVAAARIAASQQSSAVMDDSAYDARYCKGTSTTAGFLLYVMYSLKMK